MESTTSRKELLEKAKGLGVKYRTVMKTHELKRIVILDPANPQYKGIVSSAKNRLKAYMANRKNGKPVES